MILRSTLFPSLPLLLLLVLQSLCSHAQQEGTDHPALDEEITTTAFTAHEEEIRVDPAFLNDEEIHVDPAFVGTTAAGAGVERAEVAEDDDSQLHPTAFREDESSRQADASVNVESGKPQQRLWGYAPSSHSHTVPSSSDEEETVTDEKENATLPLGTPHRPFVAKQQQHPVNTPSSAVSHALPAGFTISARIYVDPKDKLAHFDDNPPSLPYWDCGLPGSTTSALPMKNAYFRLSLATAPTTWKGSDGKHPALVVALSPMEVELNSGSVHTFQAGEVLLLEDVLLPGHKMKPLHDKELQVLILTLPQPHLHTGKSHLSLQEAMMRKTSTRDEACSDPVSSSSITGQDAVLTRESPGRWGSRRLRMGVLAALGVSFSTLVADFLGKHAPLWLVVGAGGICFVVGGTYGIVLAGDASLKALEVFVEQQRLGRGTTTPPQVVVDDDAQDSKPLDDGSHQQRHGDEDEEDGSIPLSPPPGITIS